MRNPHGLGGILERARRLADVNRALHEWCHEPWMQHVRVANIRGDTLVLYSTSAAALVPLRNRSRSLLSWLNGRYTLSLTRTEMRVRPQ